MITLLSFIGKRIITVKKFQRKSIISFFKDISECKYFKITGIVETKWYNNNKDEVYRKNRLIIELLMVVYIGFIQHTTMSPEIDFVAEVE